MKRTNEILAGVRIDGRFAADGRIDLCNQCCRNLDAANATHPGCSSESRKVADHAAAECQHNTVTANARFRERLPDAFQVGERFCIVAGRQDDGCHAVRFCCIDQS